jgi:hypothetical protein
MRACVGEEGGVDPPTPTNDGATSTPGDDVEDDIERTGETHVPGCEFPTSHVNTIIHTGCDMHLPLTCPIGLSLHEARLAAPHLLWHASGTCLEAKECIGCGEQTFDDSTLDVAVHTLQGSITHWLCPGEEMLMREKHFIVSCSRLGVGDPINNIPTYNRKYVRVNNVGEKRYVLAKFPEVDDHPIFDAWVDVEDECHLRERYVFPPWRLLSHDACASLEARQQGLDKGYFVYTYPYKFDGNTFMIHPQPFGSTFEIPSFVRPHVMLSNDHEWLVKNFALQNGAYYDEEVRLYLGHELDESTQVLASDGGYMVVRLEGGQMRAVFPKPIMASDSARDCNSIAKPKSRLRFKHSLEPLNYNNIKDGYKRLVWPTLSLW